MANPNKKSNAKTNNQNTGFATVQEVGMTVGTFVLTDLLARKLTGWKKWLARGIGVAVTWALKSTGLLSNSFGPLFRGIAKFGNPNGNFYKTCMSIADRCDENAFKNTPFWKDSSTTTNGTKDILEAQVMTEDSACPVAIPSEMKGPTSRGTLLDVRRLLNGWMNGESTPYQTESCFIWFKYLQEQGNLTVPFSCVYFLIFMSRSRGSG